jgi:hypothetical protein
MCTLEEAHCNVGLMLHNVSHVGEPSLSHWAKCKGPTHPRSPLISWTTPTTLKGLTLLITPQNPKFQQRKNNSTACCLLPIVYITVVPFQVQHYLLAFIMRGVFFFPILVGQNLSFNKRKKRTCVAKLQQIDLEYGLHFI